MVFHLLREDVRVLLGNRLQELLEVQVPREQRLEELEVGEDARAGIRVQLVALLLHELV